MPAPEKRKIAAVPDAALIRRAQNSVISETTIRFPLGTRPISIPRAKPQANCRGVVSRIKAVAKYRKGRRRIMRRILSTRKQHPKCRGDVPQQGVSCKMGRGSHRLTTISDHDRPKGTATLSRSISDRLD